MFIAKWLEFLVEHARVVRWSVLIVMAALVLTDILLPSAYDRFVWESIGGFGAFYGLLGCALLIVLAKGLGKLIQRSEDYYHD